MENARGKCVSQWRACESGQWRRLENHGVWQMRLKMASRVSVANGAGETRLPSIARALPYGVERGVPA